MYMYVYIYIYIYILNYYYFHIIITRRPGAGAGAGQRGAGRQPGPLRLFFNVCLCRLCFPFVLVNHLYVCFDCLLPLYT